jgi:CRP-like cAMP-binding protein
MTQLAPITPLKFKYEVASPGNVEPNRLLDDLPHEEFCHLVPFFSRERLERGRVLYEPGDDIHHVYFPHGGLISVAAVMPEGEIVETMTLGREGAIGLTTGINSRMALNLTVVRLPGWATLVPALQWAAAAERSHTIRDLIVRHHDLKLARLQHSVACRVLHDVRARLSRWLLEARDRVGDDILPLTQEFLSEVLGVKRTTVTLVAQALQSAGVIHYRRGMIQIRDVAALEDAACECYHIVRRLTRF